MLALLVFTKSSTQRPDPDRRSNPVIQLLLEFSGRSPCHAVVLPDVEVKFLDLILSAGPDDRKSEPHGETGLEIDATTMPGEVGDDKAALLDAGDDQVVNLVVVLLLVHPEWLRGLKQVNRPALLPESLRTISPASSGV